MASENYVELENGYLYVRLEDDGAVDVRYEKTGGPPLTVNLGHGYEGPSQGPFTVQPETTENAHFPGAFDPGIEFRTHGFMHAPDDSYFTPEASYSPGA